MTLTEEILNNWNIDIPGYVQTIKSLEVLSFPAWTIKTSTEYGVVLIYEGTEIINESFSNAKILNRKLVLGEGEIKNTIALISSDNNVSEVFAALCAALIEPGTEGVARKEILNNPLAWWENWKEMLGNKNIDSRIYDVLGELCVLKQFLKSGEDISWNGPDGASYDLELESKFVEVKSSLARNKREVSISNHFQLKPETKALNLVLCQFEPTHMTGVSIDEIVNEIGLLGYNTNSINSKLQSMGFEEGMSSRKKKFILHEMLCYTVGDDFPRITPEMFIGGVLPENITKITYTVDLSGLPAMSMLQGEELKHV